MSELQRILEPELMDTVDEAREYDAMDHGPVNRQFVDDVLAGYPLPRDVLDVGTGNALIPIELCRRVTTCRVMAADLSRAMLEQARYRIEVAGLIGRIQLDYSDAKHMLYRDGMFDLVLCNGSLHHFADPAVVLRESLRVTAPGGWLFFRDLLRPADLAALDQLVATYAGEDNEFQRQMFRQSLQAALTLDEMRDLVAHLGCDPQSVQVTSDRHWTWRRMTNDE
jgi:ubiquinone/menaquinone biosynthesis C-methylase UbiE